MPYLGVRPADITSAAEAEIAGDFTVDTNTLKVDATNNRVGVGTQSPGSALTVEGTKDSLASQLKITATGVVSQYIGGGDNVGLAIGHDHSSLPIIFKTGVASGTGVTGSGTERLRILSGGGLTFNGDTAAANALDDYEEGTFTPRFQLGLTSPGYSVQSGTYVKVGSLVVCSVYLRANSGTENGDHIYVGGLPFTVMSIGGNSQYGAFFTYNGGFWNSDVNTQWLALDNQTNLAFYRQSDGAAIQGTTSGVATNLNADLRLVAVYRS